MRGGEHRHRNKRNGEMGRMGEKRSQLGKWHRIKIHRYTVEISLREEVVRYCGGNCDGEGIGLIRRFKGKKGGMEGRRGTNTDKKKRGNNSSANIGKRKFMVWLKLSHRRKDSDLARDLKCLLRSVYHQLVYGWRTFAMFNQCGGIKKENVRKRGDGVPLSELISNSQCLISRWNRVRVIDYRLRYRSRTILALKDSLNASYETASKISIDMINSVYDQRSCSSKDQSAKVDVPGYGGAECWVVGGGVRDGGVLVWLGWGRGGKEGVTGGRGRALRGASGEGAVAGRQWDWGQGVLWIHRVRVVGGGRWMCVDCGVGTGLGLGGGGGKVGRGIVSLGSKWGWGAGGVGENVGRVREDGPPRGEGVQVGPSIQRGIMLGEGGMEDHGVGVVGKDRRGQGGMDGFWGGYVPRACGRRGEDVGMSDWVGTGRDGGTGGGGFGIRIVGDGGESGGFYVGAHIRVCWGLGWGWGGGQGGEEGPYLECIMVLIRCVDSILVGIPKVSPVNDIETNTPELSSDSKSKCLKVEHLDDCESTNFLINPAY
ncbi:hypothetical protein Tco_0661794 [Tanacetum coccineum]